MYYYLYQITNKINRKIYIGIHRTDNLNDSYFGSGRALKKAISKYKKENFTKDILCFFSSEEEMYLKEAEIVNSDFIKRDDVYNITEGGELKTSKENRKLGGIATYKTGKAIFSKESKEKSAITIKTKECREKRSEIAKKIVSKEHLELMKNKAFSEETNIKRKKTFEKIKHQQGERNSCYGTYWIYNKELKETKKIKKEELEKYLSSGWKKGRNIK